MGEATHSSGNHRPRLIIDRETTNLESHQLVWLCTSNDAVSLQSLRNIVNYVRVFSDINVCLTYIERTSDTVTFLVCSEEYLRSLIPRIHHHRSPYLVFVYIACADNSNKTTTVQPISQQAQNEWIPKCTKVILIRSML